MKGQRAWAVRNKKSGNNGYYCPIFFWTVYFEKARAEQHIKEVQSDELDIIEIKVTPVRRPSKCRGVK